MKTLHIGRDERGYDIIIGSGILDRISEYFELNRRVLIITDAGVPSESSERVAAAVPTASI